MNLKYFYVSFAQAFIYNILKPLLTYSRYAFSGEGRNKLRRRAGQPP